jgi:ubiquinol oxidase
LSDTKNPRKFRFCSPVIAKHYWKLADGATLRDVVLVVRADKAHNGDINHGFASKLRGAEPATAVTPILSTRTISA